ncbi:MAG TPA: NADP-dependent oxidoreductase [Ignavibacteria bacterium]|nr:NADP-dependent oxidoreductase [Ignavibacteria bacterium]
MIALQYDSYGSADVLKWNEIEIPEPSEKQVLIKIKAASLNPTDSKKRLGLFFSGGEDKFPKSMGMDFAGIVSKTGSEVSQFKEGDEVLGYIGLKGGSFADYVLADAAKVFKKPAKLKFEEAATLPMNAGTALKVTNNYIKPSEGKTILINGASGGIGLFVLQFCKIAGSIVSGTTSGEENINKLNELGADEVFDFEKENILKSGKTFDAILDTSGKLDFNDAKSILNENGEFITMVPKSDPKLPGQTDGSKMEILVNAVPGLKEFTECVRLAEEEKIIPLAGKTFPMSDAIDVIKKFDNGEFNVTGKIVLIN